MREMIDRYNDANMPEEYEVGETYDINDDFSFDMESEDSISLHFGMPEVNSLSSHLSTLRTGFKELASYLKYSPTLKDVETITATSWIVTERPSLMEKLGFIVDNTTEQAQREILAYNLKISGNMIPADKYKIPPSCASISKEKFLELYSTT